MVDVAATADPSARTVTRARLEDLRGKRTLLVASTGGHLTQLVRLAPGIGVSADSPWLTFDMPQSHSLLAGREVHFVPYVRPRDVHHVLTAGVEVQSLLRDVEAVLSTGAGLALSALPQMALTTKKPAVYLESISRVNGPSLTGRILARLPRVGLYAQHTSWLRPPWRAGPSVLASYELVDRPPRSIRSIFVTLGTIAPYRFDRLVDLVLAYLRQNPSVDVIWQLGCTTRVDLPGRTVTQLGDTDFAEAVARADLVVAHSGVGVAMNILDKGRIPVLLARRSDRGEHVDDHQHQILDYLVRRDLALDASSALTRPDGLLHAMTHEVIHR